MSKQQPIDYDALEKEVKATVKADAGSAPAPSAASLKDRAAAALRDRSAGEVAVQGLENVRSGIGDFFSLQTIKDMLGMLIDPHGVRELTGQKPMAMDSAVGMVSTPIRGALSGRTIPVPGVGMVKVPDLPEGNPDNPLWPQAQRA